MQIVSFEIISAATLATLGLIAISLLASRKTSDEIKTVNAHILTNLEKLSSALKKPKVNDVFVYGYPALSAEIKSAINIKLFSIGLDTTINNYKDDFQDMLARGGSIQILVSDKSDRLMEILAFRGSGVRDPEKYRNSVVANLEKAQTIYEFMEDNNIDKSLLQIREIPYFPTAGMFIIESENRDIKIHVQITSFRVRGTKSPGFEVTRADGEWFTYFLDQFQSVWASGKTV
jgi:hypothetical protein